MRYNPDIHHRNYSRTMISANVLGGTKILGHKIKSSLDGQVLKPKGNFHGKA